jgi:hypothetical protein
MANGNGNSDGLPAWARSLVTLILQHGVAAAVALFLVYWMSARLTRQLESIEVKVDTHVEQAAIAGKSMTAFADTQRETTREMLSILRQMCINTSKTDTQRKECVQ